MKFPVILSKWSFTIIANGGSTIIGLLLISQGFHWNVTAHNFAYLFIYRE